MVYSLLEHFDSKVPIMYLGLNLEFWMPSILEDAESMVIFHSFFSLGSPIMENISRYPVWLAVFSDDWAMVIDKINNARVELERSEWT